MKTEKQSEMQTQPHYSFFQKIIYTLFGYPPVHKPLSNDDWEKWKSRFDDEQYDFKKHSGGKNG